MTARVPSKRETLLEYLERGVTMVHLDARRPGVAVPTQFAGEAHLRLNVSYRYGIPDLLVDDRRVQATLSFGGRPFQCQLPWSAIFGITSHATGDGQVWPEDLPIEVMQTLAERSEREGSGTPTPERGVAPVRRPPLRAIENEPLEEASPKPEGETKRPHLRLVR